MRRTAAASRGARRSSRIAIPAGAQEPPDPETAVPDPPHFGFNDEWATHADKLNLVKRAGADTTRAVLSWRVVETERGQYDWSRYDQLAAEFRAVGTRPLWVLADAPCWAWTKGDQACAEKGLQPRPPRPNHYDDWAVFAAHVANRYPDAVAIESWNEANLDNFFMPKPDPVKAANLAYWANAGVDFANLLGGTEIPVLFGGSAPLYETIPEKNEIAYDEFLRAAYDEVPASEHGWDGVAMHPFPRFKAREGYLERHRGAPRRDPRGALRLRRRGHADLGDRGRALDRRPLPLLAGRAGRGAAGDLPRARLDAGRRGDRRAPADRRAEGAADRRVRLGGRAAQPAAEARAVRARRVRAAPPAERRAQAPSRSSAMPRSRSITGS